MALTTNSEYAHKFAWVVQRAKAGNALGYKEDDMISLEFASGGAVTTSGAILGLGVGFAFVNQGVGVIHKVNHKTTQAQSSITGAEWTPGLVAVGNPF